METSDTIRSLKDKVSAKIEIPAARLFVIFAGQFQPDSRNLSTDCHIQRDSTVFVLDTQDMTCRFRIRCCQRTKSRSMVSLPDPMVNNPPKTLVPDGIQFEPALVIQSALRSSDLVLQFGIDAVPGLVDIIASYCNEPAVCYGDIISILARKRDGMFAEDRLFESEGFDQFRVMRGYADTSYDGQPVRFGQDFVLRASTSDNQYVERTDIFKKYVTCKNGALGLTDFPTSTQFFVGLHAVEDCEAMFNQTLQFDISEPSAMGSIVRYGVHTDRIAISIGGNRPIKTDDDHNHPCNECRASFLPSKDDEQWTASPFI